MNSGGTTKVNRNNVIWTNSESLSTTHIPDHNNENSKTESTSIDVILPYTQRDMTNNCIDILTARAGINIRIIAVEDNTRLGFIAITNHVFQQSNAQFVAYVAQDAFPGRYWMKIGIDTLNNTNKSLLAFNDGKWFGQLAAFGLVRRTWAEKIYPNQQLFFDGYHSHYADTELSIIAASQNMLAYNPNSVLIEVDFHKDKKPTHSKDKDLYALRAGGEFGGLVEDKVLLNRFS